MHDDDDNPLIVWAILILVGMGLAAILFYGLACNGQGAANFCF